jgi:hypothetical protein
MAFAIPKQRFIMVYHIVYPLVEVKCYTNDGLLMGLGWKGHHSEQTNRTSPTQWMFVIKICGVLCEHVLFSLFQWVKTVSMQETSISQAKKCHYMPMSAMAMSYQCTSAPVYPDSIDFLKGHTFHPHSATAWQHPGHSYDFLLYFPRKSSGHLPVLFMTPFHVSHSRTPQKDRSFCKIPFKWWRIAPFLSFLGGCQKIRFVDFCGFERWQ